jgi:hypothetical protein
VRNTYRPRATADRSMRALDLANSEAKQGSVPSSTRTSFSSNDRQSNPPLGLSPLQQALWGSKPSSDRVWYNYNERTHTAYDRYNPEVLAGVNGVKDLDNYSILNQDHENNYMTLLVSWTSTLFLRLIRIQQSLPFHKKSQSYMECMS